jgi:NAD(P)-dependent dehydrogenase (short-subunit alcohol dehydrogenase family)
MSNALVTGTSTGIGYATALRLARDGHHVVASMRDPDGSDLAARAAAESLSLETIALDVVGPDVEDRVAEVVARLGRIDVLVNNAGIGDGGVVEETELEVYRRVMETNFFGPMRCIKAVLPSMRARGGGAIVNVTSQAGVLQLPAMSAYCASKHALEAAGGSLAVEVAPFGIRVANIEPGAIMTAIWSKVDMAPPTGPYVPILRRLTMATIADVSRASSADEVADCIAEAIVTDTPRLQWLVGQGAERNVEVRRSMTSQAYIDMWNLDDEDEFARLARTTD